MTAARRRRAGNGREAGLVESASEQDGVRFVAAVVDDIDADTLLAISDRVKARLAPAAVVLGSSTEGKVHLVRSLDQPVVDRGLSAVDLIREIAPIVGGGGGGRPTMARAGGKRSGAAGRRDRGRRDGDSRAAQRTRHEGARARLRPGPHRPGGERCTGTLARPLGVVERVGTAAGLAQLMERIGRASPELVVVGLPLTLRGEVGEQARETLTFVERLRKRCSVPVETYDERFTTTLASPTGSQHGDDALAAAHLLEGYLTRLAG